MRVTILSLSVMGLMVLMTMAQVDGSSLRGSHQVQNSGTSYRNRRHNHRGRTFTTPAGTDTQLPPESFLMCPEVRCPVISDTCETVEFIVYEYDYDHRGHNLRVRCESCRYCLDMPPFARRRRSPSKLQLRRQKLQCDSMSCPEVSEMCVDIRLTDVTLNGQLCGQCPACYDLVLASTS